MDGVLVGRVIEGFSGPFAACYISKKIFFALSSFYKQFCMSKFEWGYWVRIINSDKSIYVARCFPDTDLPLKEQIYSMTGLENIITVSHNIKLSNLAKNESMSSPNGKKHETCSLEPISPKSIIDSECVSFIFLESVPFEKEFKSNRESVIYYPKKLTDFRLLKRFLKAVDRLLKMTQLLKYLFPTG